MRRWLGGVQAAGFAGILACAATSAWAQGAPGRTWDTATFLTSIVSTVVFGLLGIVMAILGFKLFDAAIPFNLAEEVCQKQNIAVALVTGSMVLGICVIIAVVVL